MDNTKTFTRGGVLGSLGITIYVGQKIGEKKDKETGRAMVLNQHYYATKESI